MVQSNPRGCRDLPPSAVPVFCKESGLKMHQGARGQLRVVRRQPDGADVGVTVGQVVLDPAVSGLPLPQVDGNK